MQSPLDLIRESIARDELQRALEESSAFGERLGSEQRAEIIALRARVERVERQARRGLISSEDEAVEKNRIGFALLAIVAELETFPAAGGSEALTSVFISYSRADRPVMEGLNRVLSGRGIEVWIDRTRSAAGERITDFIQRAIRETDVTLSIVSETSLLSDWVALETLHTFAAERYTSKPRFIAGYLDRRFFDPAFRLEATASIDRRLSELDRLAVQHREQQLDTRDLERRHRLITLRNGLGEILARLRESLTLDLTDHDYEGVVEHIYNAIASEPPSSTL